MSLSDHSIRIILIAVILVYITVWAVGLCTGKTVKLLASLNAVSGLVIIGYWALRQWQITQHSFEIREVAVLCFEAAVVALSLYCRTGQGNNWIKVFICVFFGLHLIALLLFFLFMTTFKITRLI